MEQKPLLEENRQQWNQRILRGWTEERGGTGAVSELLEGSRYEVQCPSAWSDIIELDEDLIWHAALSMPGSR